MATAQAMNTLVYALMGTYPDIEDANTFSAEELGETVKVCRQWGLERVVVRHGGVHLASSREPIGPYLSAAQRRGARAICRSVFPTSRGAVA